MATKTKAKTVKKSSSADNQDLAVRFNFERETKNTYRFYEVADEPVIGTLYIQKSALNGHQIGEDTTLMVIVSVK